MEGLHAFNVFRRMIHSTPKKHITSIFVQELGGGGGGGGEREGGRVGGGGEIGIC